jgi:signal transduction histidine kinase
MITIGSAPRRQGFAMHRALGSLRRSRWGVSIPAASGIAVLSGWAVVHGISRHTGIAASIAVLAMVTPAAFARRAPREVAIILAVGTLVNELFFGHLVRCGAALPAAFYVGYVLAIRTTGRQKYWSLGFVGIDVALQCLFDPRLGGSQIVLMGPVLLLFFGAGELVRARSELVAQLRARNAQLSDQRERTAQLAVAADQARIGDDLIEGLRMQIHDIADLSTAARSGEVPIGTALSTIEHTGRAALDQMRDIVGTIRSAPTEPEPGLDALAELLQTATACGVRLRFEGERRTLPASIELSSYRIVERLIRTLQDDPAARGQVRVTFEAEALELVVTGPLEPDLDVASSFSGVLDRAAVHGGTVRLGEPAGQLDALVRLPLVSSHA